MIRVGVFNVNGLQSKADLLFNFMSENHIDIMIILETHLVPNGFKSTIFKNPLLNISHVAPQAHRGGRKGIGGLMIICHNTSIHQQIRIVETNEADQYAFIEIGNVIIGTGYFPPRNTRGTEAFQHFLDKASELGTQLDKHCLITGDFNARSTRSLDHHNAPVAQC